MASPPSDRDAARDLVRALEEMADVSREQSRRLEEARERLRETQQVFRDAMSAKMEGKSTNVDLSRLIYGRSQELAEGEALSGRRKEALLEAFHALMWVYVYESSRELADSIF